MQDISSKKLSLRNDIPLAKCKKAAKISRFRVLHKKQHNAELKILLPCIGISVCHHKPVVKLYEPYHEIMVLSVLLKLILQMRMRSHPVGLYV